MLWTIDSSIHGAVYGEKAVYEMWISTDDGKPDVIKGTIAHELAHIHAKEFYTKSKGKKVFYSHGKLHKKLEQYYLDNWSEEINKLYARLRRAKLDVFACDEVELKSLVNKMFNKEILVAAKANRLRK